MAPWSTNGPLNTLDEIAHVLPGTQSPTLQQDGQNYGKLITKDSQVIVQDQNGVNRVLLGYGNGAFGASNYGIKVSQNNVDVLTGLDSQMVMNSNFNNFKIVKSGTLTIPVSYSAPGGTNPYSATASVAHGLSSVPAFIAYAIYPAAWGGGTNYSALPAAVVQWDTVKSQLYNAVQVAGNVDATNFNATVYTDRPLWDGQYTIRYYLVQETAN